MAATSSSSSAAVAAAFLAAVVLTSLLASTSASSARRSLSSSAAAGGAATNTEFIRTSCSATAYPKLCYSSLAVHATKIQTSTKLLTSTALNVTLASAKETSAAMVKLSQTHGLSTQEAEAMHDCVEEVGDSVDEIRRSVDEMASLGSGTKKAGPGFRMMISNVETWVSAALTDEGTCNDGFAEKGMAGEVKTAVRGRIEKIAQLTSNALSLINAYASLHH